MQKGQTLIFLLVGIVVLAVAGGAFYLGRQTTPKPSPTPVENSQTLQPTPSRSPDETANWGKLNYCIGHSGTISQITIKSGKVTKPDRSGYLASPEYDDHCYQFNPVNSTRIEVGIDDMNNLNINPDNVSPNGWKVSQEKTVNMSLGGLFASNIYLTNGTNKILLEEETVPTKVFKFIGWSN